jgi:hypothetical protein
MKKQEALLVEEGRRRLTSPDEGVKSSAEETAGDGADAVLIVRTVLMYDVCMIDVDTETGEEICIRTGPLPRSFDDTRLIFDAGLVFFS